MFRHCFYFLLRKQNCLRNFCCLSLIAFFSYIDRIISSIRTKFPYYG
uniref:Uncharacterized protein n=1 Tax=Myoviridae sp. ct7CH26 TaxID=2827604 RepID=A0A8S5RSW3_9CAUD|nr:MAG TPA: hypothetical protein [Myoviridae sp. ct7CH26]DAP78322.1 MAG TPA: hypothetical protein [Caudoviricetes sp.]